jgi:hypothetical protein
VCSSPSRPSPPFFWLGRWEKDLGGGGGGAPVSLLLNYKCTKKREKNEKKRVIANWNSVWLARVVVDVEIAQSAKCPRASLLGA